MQEVSPVFFEFLEIENLTKRHF